MIYLVSDIHGHIRLNWLAEKLENLNITSSDHLVILGDAGIVWSANEHLEVREYYDLLPCKVLFVDGNHENFDLLDAYPTTELGGGAVHKITDNIFHLMRGQVFTIDGLKIFTMGGGESPDLDSRLEDNPWLKYEIPSKEELLEGAESLEKNDCKIDVIITHEPSSTIKGFLKLGESEAVRVTTLNAYFDELSKCSEFDRWFFGSLHLDKYISNTYIGVHKAIVNAHTGERVSF